MTDSTIPDMITDPSSFDADAMFWLRSAQAAIRAYCGWHVMPNVRLTGTLNARGGVVLRLPARHVTAVNSLTDRDGRALASACDPDSGLVELLSGTMPLGVAAVEYDIDAGYDDCPDVQAVVISLAKRMAASTPAGITTSQSVNGASASYGLSMLMQEETNRLTPYRLTGLP